MDSIEMDTPPHSPAESSTDICTSILLKHGKSAREEDQHLCAVVGAMAQDLKDKSCSLSPAAFFCATCPYLDRTSSEREPSAPIIAALLRILSEVLKTLSPAIIVKERGYLNALLVRVFKSSSLSFRAAVSGLKCMSIVLEISSRRADVDWSEVSQLYNILLSCVTDSRSKVREKSRKRLPDVLQSFQGTSLLVPASEGINDLFNRSLLLAGGKNKDASQVAQGGQEVLRVLYALDECLVLMSTACKDNVLKHFKPLLDMRHPLVTKPITDCLKKLCLDPCPDIDPRVLLDLLCSLSLSVANESSVDSLKFTATLLNIGIAKVYSLNRDICVTKLPTVLNALRVILGSEHEGAIHEAANSFKCLIKTCIDESLIKQGVDQILMNRDMDKRRCGPTIIEKVCATIEGLLDYHYTAVWGLAFQVVSTMFDKLGLYSSYFMRGTLKSLADLEKLPDEDFPYRKQLHECLGAALVALGPENLLGFLPLNLEAEDLSEVNVWLFPILKQYTVGARLSFFTESILGMVEAIKRKYGELERQGRIFSSRSTDALVYSLWSLLPSFCNYPADTAESFCVLVQALFVAIRGKPEIRGIICLSLQILVQQNKKIVEEVNDQSDSEVGIAQKRAMANYTPQVTTENLRVLKSCAPELLMVLSVVFLETAKDDGGCLQSTIGEFASISDVSALFRKYLRSLLGVAMKHREETNHTDSNSIHREETKSADSNSMQLARLLDLLVSFLPGLGDQEVDALFTAIKPHLEDCEGLIQKKAYKALSIILRDHDGFISLKIDELLELMTEILPSSHFSAKRHRLDCLYHLLVHVSKSETEQKRHGIVSSFLTEIILGLKETNKKTRNKAYEILVQIGHAYGDEDKGGKRENLVEFFNMVAGGLAGETPAKISAAMRGLARLAYEFSDLVSTASNLLPSTFLLLQRKNREIIKANLGLLKVLVTKSQAEGLQLHLKNMVQGLLKWQGDTKTHFKVKVKNLLEMLVKKCGLDAVKAVMPQEHMKLLTNIRKINERKERKQCSKFDEAKSLASKATTSRLSRWNDSKVFSDIDDEGTDDSDTDYMDAQTVTGRHGRSLNLKSKASSLRSKSRANWNLPDHLFDQLEDEPLDLLDRQRTRSSLRSSVKRKMESEEGPEIDSDGRLIIREEGNSYNKRPSQSDTDARSEAGSHLSAKTKNTQKRRKTSESGWASTGNEYASKKAGGDLKKKDKLEPYAYWPLDRKMMSCRPEHRAAARKGISSVVRMTKKLEGKSASSILSSKSFKFKKAQKKGSKRKSK